LRPGSVSVENYTMDCELAERTHFPCEYVGELTFGMARTKEERLGRFHTGTRLLERSIK
jgi:hypothetical protein